MSVAARRRLTHPENREVVYTATEGSASGQRNDAYALVATEMDARDALLRLIDEPRRAALEALEALEPVKSPSGLASKSVLRALLNNDHSAIEEFISNVPLRTVGEGCRKALEHLEQATTQQELAWPSELWARFDIWAREALLYNEGKHSLDHQTRKNPTVRAMIRQFLYAICANVETYVAGSTSRSEIDSMPDVTEDTVIFAINDSIARLVRLSRRMRKHIREKLDTEADQFEPPGEDGETLTRDFCDHLDWTLNYHPEFQMEESIIRERLRQTMLLRWRRVFYHSKRAEEKMKLLEQSMPSNVNNKPNPSASQASFVLKAPKIKPNSSTSQHDQQSPRKKPKLEAAPSTGFQSTGRSVGPSLKQHEDGQSTVSSRRTKSLIGVRAVDFPTAPPIVEAISQFVCPLCGRHQPATERENKNWQCVM